MTVNTAIEVLKYYVSNSEHYEATRMAIAALEKQIPKNPDYSSDGYADGKEVWDAHCPNCEREIENEKICPNCGQAIDWED